MEGSKLTITQEADGTWEVRSGDTVVATCQTNAEAWRAYDRLEGEPISRAEPRNDL